jgi:hypothetical protein
MGKSMLVGAVLAVVLVAVLGVGAYFYLRGPVAASVALQQERVVLVFESPAEDGATIAALISIVADGKMRDASPDTQVTIPGTTATRLSDAYVFGGGGAVARALGAPDAGGPTAFVAVPAVTWRAAVDATRGVTVSVPEKLTVFDGNQLVTIPSGQQKLSAAQITALLNAQSYLTTAQSAVLRAELASQMAAALAAAKPVAGQPTVALESDLSPEALAAWLQTSLLRAAMSQPK